MTFATINLHTTCCPQFGPGKAVRFWSTINIHSRDGERRDRQLVAPSCSADIPFFTTGMDFSTTLFEMIFTTIYQVTFVDLFLYSLSNVAARNRVAGHLVKSSVEIKCRELVENFFRAPCLTFPWRMRQKTGYTLSRLTFESHGSLALDSQAYSVLREI